MAKIFILAKISGMSVLKILNAIEHAVLVIKFLSYLFNCVIITILRHLGIKNSEQSCIRLSGNTFLTWRVRRRTGRTLKRK